MRRLLANLLSSCEFVLFPVSVRPERVIVLASTLLVLEASSGFAVRTIDGLSRERFLHEPQDRTNPAGSGGSEMKSYRKELWFTVPTRRAFINITAQVQSCLAESTD